MRRFFSKRRSSLSRKRKSQRHFQAACLSLGLATAWGGEASADVTFKVEITPEQTLTNAVVFYGNNRTSGVLRSLGTLPANQTSTILQTLVPGPRPSPIATEPEYYDPNLGPLLPYFVVVGLYQSDSGPGAVVSFPNSDPIDAMASWEDVFQLIGVSPQSNVTEQELIDDLLSGHPHPNPDTYVPDVVRLLAEGYGNKSRIFDGRIGTDYGQTATLVNFSAASFGGTVVVELVPEPSTWFVLVGMVGVAFVCGRRDRMN